MKTPKLTKDIIEIARKYIPLKENAKEAIPNQRKEGAQQRILAIDICSPIFPLIDEKAAGDLHLRTNYQGKAINRGITILTFEKNY